MYARDTARIATPIGIVEVTGDGDAILSVRIGGDEHTGREGETTVVRRAVDQLRAYFAGTSRAFSVPLKPANSLRGQALRDSMIEIKYGQTISYGGLARAAGSGARAIGQACARNPFPIIVPCHRVLASNGLGHYSGGDGILTKSWLLDHERHHCGVIFP